MTAVTSAQIRAALVDLVDNVAKIGNVHPYERYAAQAQAFKMLYTANIDSKQVLRGWFVSLKSQRQLNYTTSLIRIQSRWLIRGYLGLDDVAQSEITAASLFEAIRAEWFKNPSLGGLVSGDDNQDDIGPQLTGFEPVKFSDVLAHQLDIELQTEHYAKKTDLAVIDTASLPIFRVLHVNYDLPPFSGSKPTDTTDDATDDILLPQS